MPNPLRHLPSVSQLLDSPPLKAVVQSANRNVVVNGVRTFLDQLRQQVSSTTGEVQIPSPQEIAQRVAQWLRRGQQPMLRPVINGTGVLLHTGLGRAPLAPAAIEMINHVASGYCNLELDLESGQRGRRTAGVQQLLTQITGAESAAVVNNNAAATLITLAAITAGREVIVARGQLVEIGGSYRLPEVMQCSGSKLREVGTTNKTRLSDYSSAIRDDTAAILRVHPSNYQIVGFTEQVPLAELVRLAHRHDLPLIDDIGSGALVDFAPYGLTGEPLVSESIAAGADLVLFSGDKLLGGPQCGIILGRRELVTQITSHPMMRALRVDKLTLAALTATLQLYLGVDPQLHVPLLQMLDTPLENLRQRAERLAPIIGAADARWEVEIVSCESTLGGGSLPNQTITSWGLAIQRDGENASQLATSLRQLDPPIMTRVHHDRVLVDLRTVHPKWDSVLATHFTALSEQSKNGSENSEAAANTPAESAAAGSPSA